MNTLYTLFATCPRGLETVLSQELGSLGCTDVQAFDGGVSCRGGLEQAYAANLHSRTAGRILLRLTKGTYRTERDIYKLAKTSTGSTGLPCSRRSKSKSRQNAPTSKPPICRPDRQRCRLRRFPRHLRRTSERGQSRARCPHPRLLDERNVEIFIDTSGEALFKRGYRLDTGEAPLRENLAAGLLLSAGYDGTQPFQDPFCGSGTIAIEAAWIAAGRAPGMMRRFGFEKLQNFDKTLWADLRRRAEAQTRPVRAPIAGSDNGRRIVQTALDNAHNAGADDIVSFSVAGAQSVRPNGENGIMVSNPPYGVRLEEVRALQALYPQLGTWLKKHYAGWRVGMFTGDREMPKFMRLLPKRKIPLYNGNLDCRLFLIDMVQGSNR
ncbi:putative methylase [Neisseria gonorrhoeae]|uniref:Putative methylase n=1 Tax=Neisseria gonorrhoeae TaxID=485 RepID=A0A378VV75_NEIGO|nr:putative methylase [Neisseria gonorrhoeae]